ncbi:MAG: S-layer family protein, partial [Chloroflexaceae bacterium]|nr:S-layer family protein [Chloroflexaceae bacterium]
MPSVNGATIVNLGDVFVSALSTINPEGDGGAVNLLSNSNLSAETIDASGLVNGGNITVTADEIDLIGGSTSVISQGELLLQPLNPAQPIAIAASSNQLGTLTLKTSDLAALGDGFSQIVIGRDDSSGQIELLETVTFVDPTSIQATGTGGSIFTPFTISTSGNLLNLQADGRISVSDITSNGGGVEIISNSGDVAANNITSNGGDISLTAASDPTGINPAIAFTSLDSNSESGAGGAITLTAQGDIVGAAGGMIALGSAVGVDSGPLSVFTPGSVEFNSFSISSNGADLQIGDGTINPTAVAIAGNVSTGGGDLRVNSTGSLEFGAAGNTSQTLGGIFELTAGGSILLFSDGIETNGGDISITGSGIGIFTDADPFVAINSTGGVGGNITITATTSGINLGASSIDSGNLIRLNAATNANVGTLTAAGGDVEIGTEGFSFPQTVEIGGTVFTNGGNFRASSSGDIVFSDFLGSANTSGGIVTLTAGGAVLLPDNGIFSSGGNITINGSTVATVFTDGLTTLNSVGGVGDITIAATTNGIDLNGSAINSGGSIDLDAAGNINTGSLTTDGGNITIGSENLPQTVAIAGNV